MFLELRGLRNYPPRMRPVLLAKALGSRALSRVGMRQPQLAPGRNPTAPRRLEDFKLYALLGTWMEEDVVAANVYNAFRQGCDRVLLIDNESPDETVAEATAAGAELVGTFHTEQYDEDLRIDLMNQTVARVSSEDDSSYIWWLWLDADEFPHGPRGITVREFLSTLDDRFRVVGARYFNHYPGAAPHYVAPLHPLDFQPLCEELLTRTCRLWHRKHPLQRFDRDSAPIRCESGFHRVSSEERPLLEPTESIFLHHFPFREQETTLRRLRALFGAGGRADPDDFAAHHMQTRLRSAEAVYAGNWEQLDREIVQYTRRPHARPRAWTDLVEPKHTAVARWYPTE